MAGKLANLSVVIPKKILTAARSRPAPTQTADKGTEIRQQQTYSILNNTVRNYKTAQNVIDLLRHMARGEGPFSTAVHNIVAVANNGYVVQAFDAKTHQFSQEGVNIASSVLASFDTLFNFTEGFTQKKSLESLIAFALREVTITGALSAELVLSKEAVPDSLQIIGAETLHWYSNGKGGAYPGQVVDGEEVSLNIPTFWVSYLHPDPGMVFPRSMMEASIKLIIYFQEFMEDIQRSVRVSGHNRTKITLDSKQIMEMADADTRSDPAKLQAFMETIRSAVQAQVEALTPEQAFILFDVADADTLQSGMGTKLDYTPLLNVISGQYATSMKTPPSVLGLRLESGSQALGNVETLIFLKSAKAVQAPVEEVFSRALTLACRLFGADVYVRFQFDPLDLRPEIETEAFQTMRQQRLLELLSLGFLTDEQFACLAKTGPRPEGSPPLSGTMFHSKGSAGGNPPTFPGDTAMGRVLQPETPDKAGGKSK